MNPQPRPARLGAEQEQLYRHLLRSLPAPLADHAAALGWELRQAVPILRDLERLQLVSRAADGTLHAEDPRATVGRLLDEEESDLDRRRRELMVLRGSLESFEVDYRRGQQFSGPRQRIWEQVIPSRASAVVDRLFRTSGGDVLQVVGRFDVGPGHDESVRRQFQEVATSGRAIRTIFPLSMLDDAHWHAFAQDRAKAGEQQRFLTDEAITVEFAIWCGTAVLLDEGGGQDGDFVLLRSPAVLSVFAALFDELWRRAEPMLSRDASTQDAKLVEMLTMGFKDEAIARQLGLSLRTVRRRVAALMVQHGVETRFQLGRAVSGRGLIGTSR
ncbi:MAG: hypothetical protein Q4P07_06025 [Ornithinimicrobium sp.]|uniref:hypothetical protein n=1 Tax=Ornithinimicrobium sp. TaxID=1977084 RepID=UPI0026DFA0BB|nr:hypothetical protein [Ornithinimicrobium sp.]MDO5739689.1 hypothetical protein [Ornithinimicrobium sp.]